MFDKIKGRDPIALSYFYHREGFLMKRFLVAVVLSAALVGCCVPAECQTLPMAIVSAHDGFDVEEAGDDPFHRGVIKAAQSLVKKGEIRRIDLIRLRVAMISPAFREHAKDLAIVQICASGVESDMVPMGADGQIDEAAIDWEGLTAFMEKLIPLIIMLIKAFGGGV